MSWVDFLENPKSIKELFSIIPKLNNIQICNIEYIYDGPDIKMKIILKDYPDQPPKRWIREGFNKLIIILRFYGIRENSISNWNTSNILDINFSNYEKDFILVTSRIFKYVCGHIAVDRFEPYME